MADPPAYHEHSPPGYHAHALPSGRFVVHCHAESDQPHSHASTEVAAAEPSASPDEAGTWHKHEFQGLRARHQHVHAHAHAHHESAQAKDSEEERTRDHCADHHDADHAGHMQGGAVVVDELVPLRPWGWRCCFPAWDSPHPLWDLWPVWQIRPSHAKAHYNSSGVDDFWPGGLTVLTQGLKVAMALAAWFIGVQDPETFYTQVMPVLIVATSSVLAVSWIYFWPQGRFNVALTLICYVMYIVPWSLSVLVVYERTEAFFNIPGYWALVPTLGPPAYITIRTLLFLPSANRRKRFLLAALSNRAVPLELNFHVVGPADTWRSHCFLTMLNTWAMLSTLAAKIIIFAMKAPGPLDGFLHAWHLLSCWWASLYAIRCRQVTVDLYMTAEARPISDARGEAKADAAQVIGRGAEMTA